jgi:hypothetical protein
MGAVYFFVTFWPFSRCVTSQFVADTKSCSRSWENSVWLITAFFARALAAKIEFVVGAWMSCPGIFIIAKPVTAEQPVGVFCADCQSSPLLFDWARSPLRYAFPVDTALKALKFKRQVMYAPALATILLPTLHEAFLHVDALVPVPLHRLRHATRGFN